MKRKQKRRKGQKVPKGKRKPRIPRKYFGKPSQLMMNTVLHAAIRILRRERQRLRKLLSEEYGAISKMHREQSELLMKLIDEEVERLRIGIVDEAGRIRPI